MKLIVGLGNPGKEYTNTRHNAGFMLVDELAKKLSAGDFKMEKKFNAEIATGNLNGDKIILVKPQTFMNNSGQAVRAVMDFYKLTPADVIVAHDDKDILIGEYKNQNNRGAAGHNGVKSIIEHLGTQDFARVRIGVAPQERAIDDTADFVLGKFSKDEKNILEKVFTEIIARIKQP